MSDYISDTHKTCSNQTKLTINIWFIWKWTFLYPSIKFSQSMERKNSRVYKSLNHVCPIRWTFLVLGFLMKICLYRGYFFDSQASYWPICNCRTLILTWHAFWAAFSQNRSSDPWAASCTEARRGTAYSRIYTWTLVAVTGAWMLNPGVAIVRTR